MKYAPLFLSLLGFCSWAMAADPQARLGQAAPAFSLPGTDEKTHALKDYAGKFIVLEWTNPECPVVKKFYDSATMQKLQATYTAKGVVWLRIDSSAPGQEGGYSAKDLARYDAAQRVAATASLLDPQGQVGHLYGARKTPQVFLINPQGVLIYAGGIDNIPSANPADIVHAKNYLVQALDEAQAGRPVTIPSAPSYGCSVKYAE